MDIKLISVVIPVYNAENTILSLLNGLVNQTLKSELYEVILVDNNSSDRSSDIISNFIEKNNLSNFKHYFFNDMQSSYASRNYGVKKSDGDILVFTDSDCNPDIKWLENIKHEFEKDNLTNKVVAGEITIQIKNKSNIWENYDSLSNMNNSRKAKSNSAATANLAVYKEIFYNVGEFNEVVSGGDIDWTKRAHKKGNLIRYNPNIEVYHPSRKNYNEINKKIKRIGYGKGQLVKESGKFIFKEIFIYFLKIFYFKTNYRLSKKLLKNCSLFSVLIFNICFLKLKSNQLIEVYKGYKDCL